MDTTEVEFGKYTPTATLQTDGRMICDHCQEEIKYPDLHIHTHNCTDKDLQPIAHDLSVVDWNIPGSQQGYQMYKCKVCGDLWGCRYQWDAGTGDDDKWHRFGKTANQRHY